MRGNVSKSIVSTTVNMNIPESGVAAPIVSKASGETIRLKDSAALPFEGFKLLGKTKQTQTTGKNLIPFPYADGKLKTQNGVTFTVKDDGGIVVNGTATADANFIIYQEYAKLPENALDQGASFRVSATGGDHSLTKMYVDVAVRENTTETAYGTKSMKTVSGNEILNSNSSLVARNFYTIQLVVKSGYKANNVTVYPMLERGTVASSYEPYTGRKPSPSPEYPQAMNSAATDGNVDIEATGKNLLKLEWSAPTKVVNGVTFTLENGLVYAKGTATSTAFLQINNTTFVRKGYTYTLSGAPSGGSQSSWLLYTSNNASDGSPLFPINLQDWGNGARATASADGYAVTTIRVTGGCTIDAVFKPMLEIGTTATEFEPCKRQTISVPTPNGLPGVPVTSDGNYIDENGQHWVCDEIDFEKGVYIQRIGEYELKVKDVERWNSLDHLTKEQAPAMCSISADKIGFDLSKEHCFAYGGGGLWECGVYDFDIDVNVSGGRSAFHTTLTHYVTEATLEKPIIWLAMNTDDDELLNISTKYEGSKMLLIREEPIETPLSAEKLAEYRYLCAHKPVTHINNDEGAYMEVEYVADTKNYIDNKFADLESAIISLGGNV